MKVSSCCHAKVSFVGFTMGQSFYACVKCNNSCEAVEVESTPQVKHE